MPSSRPPDEPDFKAQQASVTALIRVLGLVALALALALFWTLPSPSAGLVALLFAALAGGCLWLIRLRQPRLVALGMIATAIVTGMAGILVMGTVRSAAGFVLVGAVAAAGVFLNRKALIATVGICVAALGLVTWIESQGGLVFSAAPVGWSTWLVHAATLVVVARIVHFGRSRENQAMRRMFTELEQRHSMARERDRSMDRFARIFRNSPSPMLAQSARTATILDINPVFARTFGYEPAQVLGRTDLFLWADAEQRKAYTQQLFASRRVHQFACTTLHADGGPVDLLVSSELGSDQDDPLIITTLINISEPALTLERLHGDPGIQRRHPNPQERVHQRTANLHPHEDEPT